MDTDVLQKVGYFCKNKYIQNLTKNLRKLSIIIFLGFKGNLLIYKGILMALCTPLWHRGPGFDSRQCGSVPIQQRDELEWLLIRSGNVDLESQKQPGYSTS